MYHVSAQGADERVINVHYYYYYKKWLGGKLAALGDSMTLSVVDGSRRAPVAK